MTELDPGNPVIAAMSSQEALNRWSEAVDGLTNALSYAKAWTPPADTGNCVTVTEFTRRAAELVSIAVTWPHDDR